MKVAEVATKAATPEPEKVSDSKPSAVSGSSPATAFSPPQTRDAWREFCHDAGDPAKFDLCQKWRVAEAAEASERLARDQYRLSVLGMWAIALTLGFAGVAAFAAVRNLTVVQETSKRQLRAYVDVDQASITKSDALGQLEAGLRLLNSGQTPAYDVTWRHAVAWLPYPFTEESFHRSAAELASDAPSTMAAGGASMLTAVLREPVPAANIEAYQRGTMAIAVFGEITYRDTFGEHRSTAFRLYNTSASGDASLRRAPSGNHST